MSEQHHLNSKAMVLKLGNQLRKLRNRKELSLEELARITKVSKVTLGNIERGEANPSLSVIWKIANALAVPLSTLLAEEKEISISRVNSNTKVESEDGNVILEPIFSPLKEGFEMYRAYIKPESEYCPGAHQPGVIEYLTVMAGEIIVTVEDDSFHLHEFEGIRFHGDCEHAYINPSKNIAVLHFVMSYSI